MFVRSLDTYLRKWIILGHERTLQGLSRKAGLEDFSGGRWCGRGEKKMEIKLFSAQLRHFHFWQLKSKPKSSKKNSLDLSLASLAINRFIAKKEKITLNRCDLQQNPSRCPKENCKYLWKNVAVFTWLFICLPMPRSILPNKQLSAPQQLVLAV